MVLPDDDAASLFSHSLPLPDCIGSVIRFNPIDESIDLKEEVRNVLLFKNYRDNTSKNIDNGGEEELEIATYVAIKPINNDDDDDGINVYKSARVLTKKRIYPDNSRLTQTYVHKRFVTLKVCDHHDQESMEKMEEQVKRSRAVRDGRLLPVGDCFVDKQSEKFCAVIFSSPLGSLRTIMKNRFPLGFPEDLITIALRKILKPLRYLHARRILHRDVNAAHVYLFDVTHESFRDMPRISLGFAATAIYDEDDEDDDEITAPYLPMASMSNWAAAPEVYNDEKKPYTEKADVWLVGITALELAYGGLKVANRNALEALIKEIHDKKKLPGKTRVNPEIIIDEKIITEKIDAHMTTQDEAKPESIWEYYWKILGMYSSYDDDDDDDDSSFSETFTNMVMQCLAWDPKKRPNVNELMSHKFLRKSSYFWGKGEKYFYDTVMKKPPMKRR